MKQSSRNFVSSMVRLQNVKKKNRGRDGGGDTLKVDSLARIPVTFISVLVIRRAKLLLSYFHFNRLRRCSSYFRDVFRGARLCHSNFVLPFVAHFPRLTNVADEKSRLELNFTIGGSTYSSYLLASNRKTWSWKAFKCFSKHSAHPA